MSIDPDIAWEVARRNGLSMTDAAALADHARDEDHAQRLAQSWAPPEQAMDDWLRSKRHPEIDPDSLDG